MSNEYGLDASYHKGKLELLIRDIDRYTPDEYARTLLRLVGVSSPITMAESEFNKVRIAAISDVVNAPPVVLDEFEETEKDRVCPYCGDDGCDCDTL